MFWIFNPVMYVRLDNGGENVILKTPAKLLAEEWDKPYPTIRGFINARISIALVRETN